MYCKLFFFMLIYSLWIIYRGIVSMVAHRSPKPPVWVRILLPLPSFKFSMVVVLNFFIYYKHNKTTCLRIAGGSTERIPRPLLFGIKWLLQPKAIALFLLLVVEFCGLVTVPLLLMLHKMQQCIPKLPHSVS